MKRSSYYAAGLLLVATASNVFGGNITVENQTKFDIEARMETGGVTGKGIIGCPDDALFIKSGQSKTTRIGTSKCPLVNITAQIKSSPQALARGWSGNITEDATFVVKPNPNDAASFIVVKE